MEGLLESEGLLDLQVNGFAGIDFNDAGLTPEAMDRALEAMLATGVTHCLPTIITASEQDLTARFRALDRAVSGSRLGALMVPGYHLEGPFLNPAAGFAGCHPAHAMIAPDAGLVGRLEAGLDRPILLVTLAPERLGSEDFVAAMRAAHRLVAIGHSAVDAPAVARAAEAGATLSTHLGNGLPHQLHKLDNPLFAQLAEDRLAACFIADGIHLPPFALKAMIRAKGVERSILVTDAVAAAGAPPGVYGFAGMAIEHAADGSVRVPGASTLAGSGLTLDRALRNVVAWGIASPEEALRLAGANPRAHLAPILAARRIRLAESRVAWSDALHVLAAAVGDERRDYPAGGETRA